MKGLSTEEKPRTFQICWHNPPWTAGQGTFVNDIIEKAGGTNIFADLEGWKSVSLEEIVARDPEVIIVTAMGGTSSETWNWVNTEPRLEDTAARENGRAYFVESDWVELAGPRAVDGLEAIAKCVHPEIFGEPEE
jgi:iron complex transport system substrate-binding protein